MQGEDQPSPLRHPLDMIVAVQPWMFLAIVPMVVIIEGFFSFFYYHLFLLSISIE